MTDILVVDDEQNIRDSLEMVLTYENYGVFKAANGKEALNILEQNKSIQLAILDIKMPGMDGIELLEKIKSKYPEVEAIMVSGNAEITLAVEATKKGAYDFLEKPLDQDRILITINNVLKKKNLTARCKELERIVDQDRQLLGNSPAIAQILATIERVAPTEARVLITGENGTGKELVARAIHNKSKRYNQSLVEINCAAIPENLIESELFGHEKGAFTHAHERRTGKFELADGGSLFLDEIGDMSLPAQAKVLRVLEENKVTRVGGSKGINVNVRVIAATNKNLAQESTEGKFREDLYYRLNVVPIHMPPLRERTSDIPILALHFFEHFLGKYNVPKKTIQPDALKELQAHPWYGNVRELKNFMERMVILSNTNTIKADDIKQYLAKPVQKSEVSFGNFETFEEFKHESEKTFLLQKLNQTSWNVKKTAEILKMQRSNLYKKMEKYGLKPDREVEFSDSDDDMDD